VRLRADGQSELRSGLEVLASAQTSAAVLRQHAADVDRDAAFPRAGMGALRESGLMGLLVPREFGGAGGSLTLMAEVATVLGGACASTAMIWAMHCQQVAVIEAHAAEPLRSRVLRRVADEGALIASVTSERGKGGDLFVAVAPLVREANELDVVREAPVVTAGAEADGYLFTMRASPTSPPSAVSLVYADRAQLEVTPRSAWRALGMRGTASVGLLLKGRLPADQLIGEDAGFRMLAIGTFIPVGHIAWAACWLGAAAEAMRTMLAVFRDPQTRRRFDVHSDLFCERLARIRLRLDVVSAYLRQLLAEYERLRAGGSNLERFDLASFQIHVNNLKLIASESLFETIHELVQISGLEYGYLPGAGPLERTFRDLRSASLMLSNDRLAVANGRLALFDRALTLS
jgi:acyl-CoA dehydrogenase